MPKTFTYLCHLCYCEHFSLSLFISIFSWLNCTIWELFWVTSNITLVLLCKVVLCDRPFLCHFSVNLFYSLTYSMYSYSVLVFLTWNVQICMTCIAETGLYLWKRVEFPCRNSPVCMTLYWAPCTLRFLPGLFTILISTISVSDPHNSWCGSWSRVLTQWGSGFWIRIHAIILKKK